MRRIDRYFATTNRLRTEGTDHLLAAAPGCRRAPLRRPELRRLALRAHRRAGQERGRPARPEPAGRAARRARGDPPPRGRRRPASTWAEGIVLRYGTFYGPGTGISADPEAVDDQAGPQAPVPARSATAGGVWSFVHVADAATATVAAIEHGAAGVYQVVDDEPAPVREWLPALARAAGRPVAAPAAVVARRASRAGEAATLDDHRRPRRLERQGQARARLAASAIPAGALASQAPWPVRPKARPSCSAAAPGPTSSTTRSGSREANGSKATM